MRSGGAGPCAADWRREANLVCTGLYPVHDAVADGVAQEIVRDWASFNVEFLNQYVTVAGVCCKPADPTVDVAVALAPGEEVEELERRGEMDGCACGYDLDPTRRGRTAGLGP